MTQPKPKSTYALRAPGVTTRRSVLLVDATSADEALKIAKAPEGTTSEAMLPDVADKLIRRGVAIRMVAR